MATKQALISRESACEEALFFLRSLKDNPRQGRSNKLAEVKATLEPQVSLDFDQYFFFLRKFHYIALDREAQLRLTETGERLLTGEGEGRFALEAEDFFADQLLPDPDRTLAGIEIPVGVLPPPPPLDAVSGGPLDELEDPETPLPDRPPPPILTPASPLPAVELPVSVPVAQQSTVPPLRRAPFGESSPPSPSTPLGGLPPPPKVPVPPKGTELDVRYAKFDPLGAGPLGATFKGRQQALGTEVCIKELKDIFGYFSFLQRGEVLKRLRRELCAQAQLRHPGVVAVLDQNTEGPRPYFVTELCQGSLRERLDASGGKGLPVELVIRCFLQLCYALRAAHERGFTHHNLKPENVLFDAYGNARLSDFGLSRVIEVDAAKGLPQVFVGTGGMGYMAPELLARSRDVGPAADVYGLGILLYEMLTGQLPGRRSPMPSEVNSEASSQLDPLFDAMTQDRRENRLPDFDAVLEDFYAAFSDNEYLGRGDLVLRSDLPKGA